MSEGGVAGALGDVNQPYEHRQGRHRQHPAVEPVRLDWPVPHGALVVVPQQAGNKVAAPATAAIIRAWVSGRAN
jgi:hypothetical protein